MLNKAFKTMFVLAATCLMFSSCAKNNSNEGENENMNKNEVQKPELYEEVYDGKIIYNEPIVLIKDGNKIKGKLLYHPSRIIKITDFTGAKELDYSGVEINDRELSFDVNSGLPFFPKEFLNCETNLLKQMVQEEPYKKFNLGTHEGKINGNSIVFTEGVGICMNQIQVTYEHEGSEWQGFKIPSYKDGPLSNFIYKLNHNEKVTIVFYGASTMSGASVSSKLGIEPFMETFPELIVKGIQKRYPNVEIIPVNPSVGGMLTDWAVQNVVSCVNIYDPDLVIAQWGMNDGSWKVNPDTFTERCEIVIQSIKQNTDADILFNKSMLANPMSPQNNGYVERYSPLMDNYIDDYNVGVVDFTEISEDLYALKNPIDLLNNNINHPNDFFARIFADVILRAIFG